MCVCVCEVLPWPAGVLPFSAGAGWEVPHVRDGSVGAWAHTGRRSFPRRCRHLSLCRAFRMSSAAVAVLPRARMRRFADAAAVRARLQVLVPAR